MVRASQPLNREPRQRKGGMAIDTELVQQTLRLPLNDRAELARQQWYPAL